MKKILKSSVDTITYLLVFALFLTLLPLNLVDANSSSVNIEPTVVTLYAAQDIDVGTVTTWNNSSYLWVEYELNEDAIDEGWCLMETHVHVEKDEKDFPLAGRTQNPVPGHFDYKGYHDCVTEHAEEIELEWNVSDDVNIAAHATIERYALVEQVEVDSGLFEGVYSENELEKGRNYKFVASGTWQNANQGVLDAECRRPLNSEGWEVSYPRSLNLRVNDEWNVNTELGGEEIWGDYGYFGWGDECNGENEYEQSFMAEGDKVHFRIWDGNPPNEGWYGDNVGSIHVDIYKQHRESAWADGERFTQRGNWATYFQHKIMSVYLVSVVYEGMCDDQFGSYIQDKITLEFSDIISANGSSNIIVHFRKALRLSTEWNADRWDFKGNEAIVTLNRTYSSPRDLDGEYVIDIEGLVDLIGEPVVVPYGGIEIETFVSYGQHLYKGSFTGWDRTVGTAQVLTGEWDFGVYPYCNRIVFERNNKTEIITAEILKAKDNNGPWSENHYAAVGKAYYNGQDYNFMSLFSNSRVWMSLNNPSTTYDSQWSAGTIWPQSNRLFDIHSQGGTLFLE